VLGTPFTASTSIGISLYPHDAVDVAEIMKHADVAMYGSKRSRPGGWAFYSGPSEAAAVGEQGSERAQLVARVRHAVQARGERLRWLPMVSLEDGEVVGAEALIRWREPNGGLLRRGFIDRREMGLQSRAIGAGCSRSWPRGRPSGGTGSLELRHLGFNLSPRQLWSRGFPRRSSDGSARPRSLRAAYGRDRRAAVMADPDRAEGHVRAQAWGMGIAIDDFGTGHASLARLKVLPADLLKIDRSFIRGVDADPDLQRLVRAMVGLAENLGITPLAVGVEIEEEAAFLRELGVPLAQGFLFSPPVPAELLPELVVHAAARRVASG
jgi:EAL domain-containing protein (putative c-di-GMP-specific phosphodiesterase class I)